MNLIQSSSTYSQEHPTSKMQRPSEDTSYISLILGTMITDQKDHHYCNFGEAYLTVSTNNPNSNANSIFTLISLSLHLSSLLTSVLSIPSSTHSLFPLFLFFPSLLSPTPLSARDSLSFSSLPFGTLLSVEPPIPTIAHLYHSQPSLLIPFFGSSLHTITTMFLLYL